MSKNRAPRGKGLSVPISPLLYYQKFANEPAKESPPNDKSFHNNLFLFVWKVKKTRPGKKTGPFFLDIPVFLGKVMGLSNHALYLAICYSYDLLIYRQRL